MKAGDRRQEAGDRRQETGAGRDLLLFRQRMALNLNLKS